MRWAKNIGIQPRRPHWHPDPVTGFDQEPYFAQTWTKRPLPLQGSAQTYAYDAYERYADASAMIGPAIAVNHKPSVLPYPPAYVMAQAVPMQGTGIVYGQYYTQPLYDPYAAGNGFPMGAPA